jgi:hypothetical protein
MIEFEVYNPSTRTTEIICGPDEITAMDSFGLDPRSWGVVNVYESHTNGDEEPNLDIKYEN